MRIETEIAIPEHFTLDRIISFVSMAGKLKSSIFFNSNGYLINCKGILGMVSFYLTFHKGGTVHLVVDGSDAEEEYAQLLKYVPFEESKRSAPLLKAQ